MQPGCIDGPHVGRQFPAASLGDKGAARGCIRPEGQEKPYRARTHRGAGRGPRCGRLGGPFGLPLWLLPGMPPVSRRSGRA